MSSGRCARPCRQARPCLPSRSATAQVHLCGIDMQRMFAEATDWQSAMAADRTAQSDPAGRAGAGAHRCSPGFVRHAARPTRRAPWQRYYERWPDADARTARPRSASNWCRSWRGTCRRRGCSTSRSTARGSTGGCTRLLRGLNVDAVVISGAGDGEVCVLAAVIGAMDLGYRVIVATDAVCSSGGPDA